MKITIKDFSQWEYGRSFNGGAYGYEETATIEKGQIIDGGHYTTADFSYCHNCGSFEQDLDDHQERWGCDTYQPSHSMKFVAGMLTRRRGRRVIAQAFQAQWPDSELYID